METARGMQTAKTNETTFLACLFQSGIDEGKGKHGIPFNGFEHQMNVEISQGGLDVRWNKQKKLRSRNFCLG